MLAGYSYQSNQYRLTIDNVAAYELVLPNGTIKHVTQKDKDLWFGLRVSRKAQSKLVTLTISNRREGSIILYATSFES